MAKRMTLIQSSKVSAWMLANADDVANMSPVELAKAVWDCVGVTINHGVAKRHRAQLGIVAVAQPKPVKAPKRTLRQVL